MIPRQIHVAAIRPERIITPVLIDIFHCSISLQMHWQYSFTLSSAVWIMASPPQNLRFTQTGAVRSVPAQSSCFLCALLHTILASLLSQARRGLVDIPHCHICAPVRFSDTFSLYNHGRLCNHSEIPGIRTTLSVLTFSARYLRSGNPHPRLSQVRICLWS